MIHSARPTVTPITNIVFCCFVFCTVDKWVRTYVRTTCAKTIIPTGRDFGLAEWIKNILRVKIIVHFLVVALTVRTSLMSFEYVVV